MAGGAVVSRCRVIKTAEGPGRRQSRPLLHRSCAARRDYKSHRGAGEGAIHVGGGEGKGGEDDGEWATDIYPGAVFKRGGS